ncbi:hypothetical protein ACFQ0T_09180 [Kitasatospora gansuensis]
MRVKKLIAAAAVGSVLATGLATGAPASAAPAPAYDCTTGQVCLYYNSSSYGYGAYFMQESPIGNYTGSYFKAGKNGSSGAASR